MNLPRSQSSIKSLALHSVLSVHLCPFVSNWNLDVEMMPWEVGDEGSCCRNDVVLTPSPLAALQGGNLAGKSTGAPIGSCY